MFNEKSSIWIDRYKKFIIISFWALLIGGIILGICDVTASIDIIYDDTILDFLLWSVIGAVLACSQLLTGMLLLNFLSNVQTIREKVEQNNG